MPNGKPGDHPITDIVVHRIKTYTPEIDDMVREIAAVLEVKNKDLSYCYPELADIIHQFDESEEVDFESMKEVLNYLREELRE